MYKSLLRIAAGLSLAGAALLPSTAFAGPIAGPCAPGGPGFASTSVAPSAGSQVFHINTAGLSAGADYFTFDPKTLSGTEVTVCAISSSGQPSVAFVTIAQFVNKQLTMVAFGSAQLPAGAFTIDRQLMSAALNAPTIHMIDKLTGAPFDIAVSLSWTGIGSLVRSVNTFHVMGQGFSFTGHSINEDRGADASGSVASSTMIFATGIASFANLDSTRSGEVDIFRN